MNLLNRPYFNLWMAFLLFTGAAMADPCGMVPPISLDGSEGHIEREGEQKTYVFRKGKLQTVVIHPGFRGDVDQFGMLIPFPEAPALRKVADSTFEQIEKAVEPPTVTYWINRPLPAPSMRAPRAKGMVLESAAGPRDEVVVLKEEAVGMYEVAVLEAGSAGALKRWMDDHSYRFPDGMEATCQDYVDDGWCFVAVKTRVGRKAGVDPRPGMRKADPKKPAQASFSGQVQAMGFRFRSEKFEVPMRLSAFNGGDFHNIVYVLAEQPVAAANLPKEFVRKQVSGEKLLSHVQDLLPYVLQGGTEDDMSPNMWKELERRRDPKPHNGVAAQLFAHDLLAGKQNDLTHDFEEREKMFLDIGERLGLRGGRLDSFHDELLKAEREKAHALAIRELKGMTLTVIEGNFPPDVLARENIRFETYRLEAQRVQEWLTLRSPSSQEGGLPVVSLLLLLALLSGLSAPAQADSRFFTSADLLQDLDDPERKTEALQALKRKGRAALPFLLEAVTDPETPILERGYALTLLQELSSPQATPVLVKLANEEPNRLMKMWVRAALVERCDSPSELARLLLVGSPDPDVSARTWNLGEYPELQRPVALRLRSWSQELSTEESLRFLLLGQKMGQGRDISPKVLSVVGPILQKATTAELVQLMLQGRGNETRRSAAALLADRVRKDQPAVLSAVGEALAISPESREVPWSGGALFLPQLTGLSKSQSLEFLGVLTRWAVWAELRELSEDETRALHNNLRSYSLWSVAGGRGAGWRSARSGQDWLQAYARVAGSQAARDLLRELKVKSDSPFWSVTKP